MVFITAIVSINQAIGRCFRHSNDYSAVILIDERFSKKHFINNISQWLNYTIDICDISDCKNILRNFFGKMDENMAILTKMRKKLNTNQVY